MELIHKPVLLDECIEGLSINPSGIYVDGTLGGGGHSKEIAKRLTTGRLIGIDQDEYALMRAGENLKDFGDSVTYIKNNFSNIKNVLEDLEIGTVDGVLLDLGVSSFQLDDASRGFSYRFDAPLDMRMSKDNLTTARNVVNTYSESELARILFEYGEERYARRIAEAIVAKRMDKPIETTLELVDIIKSAMPAAAKREQGHPAKRSFQAIRIEVNSELSILPKTVDDIVSILKPGGRAAIITFHSLEDRLIKNAFALHAKGCTCPPDFPVCVCGKKPKVKIITKKPLTANAEELSYNPRSSSAKLRIIEKI
ncbi:MAG: 16S rRNA (cytosine(1402)-N(4))-methyltransferase RsmH [Bacillota bacterium]|nr:16S rRNA (cytosine(1402)-N(4))-methyltransferase RsmH [Bacillota bacterium]